MRMIDDALDLLKQDLLAGVKIPRALWPDAYVKKYDLTNLYKLNLGANCRLTYTVLAEGDKKIVLVIEVMDHRAYNRRFGYR